MKKMFTLVELIVVIAVLGILAAIIIPNISSFQEEANTTAIKSNVRNLQTGVDMYSIEHYGDVPTLGGNPTEYEPKPIDFDTMIPDYSRDLPETPGVKYWVDGWGKVWASTIDSPENVNLTSTTLKWDTVPEAEMYKVYKVLNPTNTASLLNANTKLFFYKESSKDEYIGITVDDENAQYAVSAVDSKGFESAPTGGSYKGYDSYVSTTPSSENISVSRPRNQLLSPDSGWKRYDDNNANITYNGSWAIWNNSGLYGGTDHYTSNASSKSIDFKFYGTKLRVIARPYINDYYTTNAKIIVNGQTYTYSYPPVSASRIKQIVMIEITGLAEGEHTVSITSGDSKGVNFDAVDIDSSGHLISN